MDKVAGERHKRAMVGSPASRSQFESTRTFSFYAQALLKTLNSQHEMLKLMDSSTGL